MRGGRGLGFRLGRRQVLRLGSTCSEHERHGDDSPFLSHACPLITARERGPTFGIGRYAVLSSGTATRSGRHASRERRTRARGYWARFATATRWPPRRHRVCFALWRQVMFGLRPLLWTWCVVLAACGGRDIGGLYGQGGDARAGAGANRGAPPGADGAGGGECDSRRRL